MSDEITWKQKIAQEISKIKEMDPKMRWNYFVTYYLLKTVILLLGIVMLVHLCYELKMNSRDVIISGCMVNVEFDEKTPTYLTDDYIAYRGADKKKVMAFFTEETTHFLEDNPMDQDSYEMAFNAQLFAGQYHYMILDEQGLEHFESMDIYADMEKTLSEEQLKNLSDKLVYREYQQKQTAVAISLKGTPFAQKFHLQPEEVYLVFVDVKQDVEKNRHFLSYLLEE